ncbi:MAG: uracil-DNA glycosylase family protein [Bryobacteraceae bacterium]
MLNFQQRERLRRQHRPAQVRLLFIGESPPASGRFFYRRDSGLYRAMREAFQRVHPALDDESFLAAFRDAGCYLVDLCPEPVDRLDAASRRAACRAAEESLSKRIRRHRPTMIATLLRSIESNVLNAISRAQWDGQVLHLPYPGRWTGHKSAFVRALTPVIRSLHRWE